jgi:hypothetical protein
MVSMGTLGKTLAHVLLPYRALSYHECSKYRLRCSLYPIMPRNCASQRTRPRKLFRLIVYNVVWHLMLMPTLSLNLMILPAVG